MLIHRFPLLKGRIAELEGNLAVALQSAVRKKPMSIEHIKNDNDAYQSNKISLSHI